MDHYRTRVKNYVNQANERFRLREHIVLLQIVCLSLLKGIFSSANESRFFNHITSGEFGVSLSYHGIVQSLGPLPAIVLMTFISEISGRKPAFYVLFTLSMLSSILSYVPYQQPWAKLEDFVVTAIVGGVLPITALAICEYSSPKHRFAYLVANEVVKVFGAQITRVLYVSDMLSVESSYLSLCTMLVALACLLLVRWWPESPYWLVRRGRREQAAVAFAGLRGEDAAREELRALDAARRRPSPKLFWLSLLLTLLFISVANISTTAVLLSFNMNQELHTVTPQLFHYIIITCSSIVISVVVVLVSYVVKRNFVYLGASIIPLLLIIILSIWVFLGQVGNHPIAFYSVLLISCTFLECGPFNLSLAMFIELTPQKYYTFMSCIASLFLIYSANLFYSVHLSFGDKLPLQGILLVLAGIAIAGVAILYWASPDTKNKNLFEIEELYYRKLYNRSHEEVQLEYVPS